MKYAFIVPEDFSLGCGYIMSHLREQGHDVKLFFDPRQFARGYARNGFLSKVLSVENYIVKGVKKYQPDFCLITCTTATYKWALGMAKKIKEKAPCKIIMGGVHATLVPDEVRRHGFIDEVVEGCGIEHFGGVFDPDTLWPDRESFFKELPSGHRKTQLFMTSYGCPFNCSYCGNEQLRKVKKHKLFRRSVDGCIEELKFLKAGGMKHVLFVDDILCSDISFFRDFMRRYRGDISLPFTCFIHPRFINQEVATILAASGCKVAWMGIQTGEESHRKLILNRPETNKEVIDACKLIKDAGITLMVDHICGIPGETNITSDISYTLYREIKADVINCYELLYFPKAKIIEHALNYGYLKPEDVPKIERGEWINYQQGNKGKYFYDTYAKGMVAIPLGNICWELLPLTILKLIIAIKTGRGFMPMVVLQNVIHFTWKAILKKCRLI